MDQRVEIGAAFPTLDGSQISLLEQYGAVRETEAGQVLFAEGDTSYDFIVILDGSVDIVENFGGEDRTIATHGAGRFLGEMNMLTGQAVYLSALVDEAGKVLAISPENLRDIVTEEPNLSDIILKAFLARRQVLMNVGTGLRIVGSHYSGDALRLREFAVRNRLPHAWLDLEEENGADAVLESNRKYALPATTVTMIRVPGPRERIGTKPAPPMPMFPIRTASRHKTIASVIVATTPSSVFSAPTSRIPSP